LKKFNNFKPFLKMVERNKNMKMNFENPSEKTNSKGVGEGDVDIENKGAKTDKKDFELTEGEEKVKKLEKIVEKIKKINKKIGEKGKENIELVKEFSKEKRELWTVIKATTAAGIWFGGDHIKNLGFSSNSAEGVIIGSSMQIAGALLGSHTLYKTMCAAAGINK
jgi:hypothetical protein